MVINFSVVQRYKKENKRTINDFFVPLQSNIQRIPNSLIHELTINAFKILWPNSPNKNRFVATRWKN